MFQRTTLQGQAGLSQELSGAFYRQSQAIYPVSQVRDDTMLVIHIYPPDQKP